MPSDEYNDADLTSGSASFMRLFRASPAPFLVLAPDAPHFTIREVNDAYLAATMKTRDAIVGRGVFEAFPDNPDDPTIEGVSTLRASLERVLATRKPSALPGLKYDVARTDGSFEQRWWSPVNSPVFDDRGEVEAITHNANDVTEQRRAEASLRQLNKSLEERVIERSAQLMKAEESLRQSQKLEAIGQLTGGVAHDFNNLLTVIRGSVDLLRRDNLSATKRKTYIDAIGDTADRAAGLTRQLLAFARRQALTPELIDVGADLTELSIMIETLTGSRIMLETQVPDYPCFIMADRSQLDTAIVNMAINARDAMGGKGKLTIATGPVSGIPEVRSDSPVVGDFIAITVADTGGGIPDAALADIFEPFFTTKAVGQGTGLGLSQVFGFAKQSGGDIRVDSVVGEGTTFTLYLPRLYPNEDELLTDDRTAEKFDGDGICVFVVEDNEPVGTFATQVLQELGFDSVLTLNAEEALAQLAKGHGRFHLVFSDVVMPGMSGLELGTKIRALYPSVPVILTSGTFLLKMAHSGSSCCKSLIRLNSSRASSARRLAGRRNRMLFEPNRCLDRRATRYLPCRRSAQTPGVWTFGPNTAPVDSEGLLDSDLIGLFA